MPRYNVQDPKTKLWSCYSTIVEGFITEWMDEKAYQEWRIREYGIHCGEIRDANMMSLEEAEERMLEAKRKW